MKILGRLGALIVCFMTAACSYGRVTIEPENLRGKHNILVIPYKAPPVKVEANHTLAVALLTGIGGALIHQYATADSRSIIADNLTKVAGIWNPSIAASEECLDVLKKQSKIQISNTTIGIVSELPKADKFRLNEPRTFTETEAWHSTEWNIALMDFRDQNLSLVYYNKAHPDYKNDLTLEVFSHNMQFTDNDFRLGITLKLSSTNTATKLALGNSFQLHDIPTLPEGYDFKAFETVFRTTSKEACKIALRDMGLIQY